MLHNLQATRILLQAQEREINTYLERERMLHKSQPSKEERRDGLVRWMLGQIRR